MKNIFKMITILKSRLVWSELSSMTKIMIILTVESALTKQFNVVLSLFKL